MELLAMSILVFFINVCQSSQIYPAKSLKSKILYQWIFPEYEYKNEQDKDEAVRRGELMPKNIVIQDVDYHAPTNRYFVTTPRFRGEGIPATISVLVDKGRKSALLRPFPHWPLYNAENRPTCEGPFSVFRIAIDKCNLLWALDNGRNNISLGRETQVCQPKLLIYDLNDSDRQILRYEIPTDLFTDRSMLTNLIVESYKSDCSDSIVYIADSNDHGMIVFKYADQTSYRIENKLFYQYPTEMTITSNGITEQLRSGILGLALGPVNKDLTRLLYFHGFSSVRESWVPVSVLKNQTLATNAEIARTAFVLSPGVRMGQSNVQVMTDDGVLIYTLVPQNAIACWNSRTPFILKNQHILELNDVDFQNMHGMELKGNTLLFSSNRLQNFMTGNSNGTDVKYRVMMIEDVKNLIENSPCGSISGVFHGGNNLISTGPKLSPLGNNYMRWPGHGPNDGFPAQAPLRHERFKWY